MIRTMVGALGDAALVIGLSAVLLVIDPELGAVTLALGALICAVTLEDGNRVLKFNFHGNFEKILDKLGEMPLPPYISEKLDDRAL